MRLGPADLSRVRFADRPHQAGTAVMSSQVLRCRRRVRLRPARCSTCCRARGLVPHFLTPLHGLGSVEVGLDAIRSVPRRQVRADVARAYAYLPATPRARSPARRS